MLKYLLFTSILFCLSSCHAQQKITDNIYEHNGNAQEATIETFEILEGSWTGTGLDGKFDELWMPPRDNQMHGVFRLEQEGKLIFTEFMSIMKDSIGYSMKIKHFSPDFTGWEEKDDAVDFRFIKKEGDRIYFSGLTIHRKNADNLDIYVAFKQDDGSYKEELFTYTKNK